MNEHPLSGPPEVAVPQPAAAPELSANDAQVRSGHAMAPRALFGLRSLGLTSLHLLVLSVLGTSVGTVAVTLFTTGVSTLVLVGVGAVLLVGLVYLLFGSGWFEIERLRVLYGFPAAPLRFRARHQPGFWEWLRSVLRQSIDGRMWQALLNFAVGSLLGWITLQSAFLAVFNLSVTVGGRDAGAVLGVARFFGTSLGAGEAAFASAFASPWWSVLCAVLLVGIMWGVAALHTVLSRALFGTATRSELAEQVREQSVQRAGAVRAADVERTRIERDLHDGVQPRLVSIGMTLGLAQQKIESDPQRATELIAEAHTSTKAAITELRQLARGIHTSVLDDRGLDAALSALATRSHLPVELDVRLDAAEPLRAGHAASGFRDAEAAVYFCVAEALTNAAKHSRAAQCRVTVRLRNPGTQNAVLWARIEDNGIGGAEVQPGGGLDGIANRVLGLGGQFQCDSPQGGPTAVEVTVPCAF